MVNTVFYIKTCDTSRKIIKDFGLDHGFDLREVKSKQITEGELDELAQMAGSFEALFSRRSRAYPQRELKGQKLSEKEYKALILDEYTFLKRPVVVFNNRIFIGSSSKEKEKLSAALQS